ncbi:sigma 54-interacting transcriptional regulator [bacterium]|nr:sigma 54-interacting transcriptional regulator [bacterium]
MAIKNAGDVDSPRFVKSKIFLNHTLKLINAPLVVKERLELLARIIAEYMNVDEVSIFLKDPVSDTLVLRVTLSLDPIAVDNDRIPIGMGVTGTVAKTRKYIASRNILKDPRNFTSIYAQDDKYPSILSFPILWEDELVGVVNLRCQKERDFTEAEAEELNYFTASIAGSIQNAQAYEQLEYKAKLLQLSNKIASAVSSTLDLDVILEEFAWEVAQGFAINGVLIMLMNDKGEVTKTSHYGLKTSFINEFPLDTARSCMLSGEPKIHHIDVDKLYGTKKNYDPWNICLPLISRDKNLGVISLFDIDKKHENPDGLFLSIGVDVLLHIAGLASLAIENAMIHSELKRLADEDKKKLDVIGTIYSRISAIFDAISNGIVAVDQTGIIKDFNNVARKSLNLSDTDKGAKNIDAITSYKPSLSSIISSGKEIDNRVVTFLTPNDKFAAVVNIRSFNDSSGEQRGSVISFRPMEETVKLLSRFTSQRPRFTFDDIIGQSTTLAETVRLAKLAAQSASNILIVGESGTGKELFSQSIHNSSPVADGPFIAVNCAAIPKELIESELFGYAEGAFTGARKGGYIGKFEQATGGTILLDEIGDMPLDLQVKLLRVLQEKVIQRVGSEHVIPISTRVISATNKDLQKAIRDGDFREELYWRLNVITIEIPPLRDRKIDIPEFVKVFIEKFSKSSGKTITDIDHGALQKLMDYSWSGNIRELENTIEHAVLMTQSTIITWADLPTSLRDRYNDEKSGPAAAENIEQARKERDESSRKLYLEAILQASGDVEKAAEKIGMSRATLYRRMKKYGLTDELSKLRHSINYDTQS